jgi:type IV pilus assembly protein PilA
MQTAPKKSGIPVWAIVLIVVAVGAVPVIGIMSTLAIYGVRRYLVQAKTAEGRAGVMVLAQGVAACGNGGRLPPSTAAVPATVPVSRKYQSSPSDWNDSAFACARFSISTPQYFQYRWTARTPTEGVASAVADFGSGPVTLEVDVACTSSCVVGTMRETMP